MEMQTHEPDGWLYALNSEYLEGLYEEYVRDPSQVSPEWRHFFKEVVGSNGASASAGPVAPSFKARSLFNPPPPPVSAPPAAAPQALPDGMGMARLQDRVDQLIRAYRVRGHLIAQVNPLGSQVQHHPELDPALYGLTEAHLDSPFSTSSIGGPATQTLGDILDRLRTTYCRYIGVQFMHIDDLSVRDWLQQHMEETQNRLQISRPQQLQIYKRLTDAAIFERFVRTKYVGAKTYSLEGAESLIPLLHLAIEKAADDGVEEIVFGMAHRGRLNVLVNILGKSPQQVFQEFEDVNPLAREGRGDVKYHLGYSSDWVTAGGKNVHLSLSFNPSHLEFVNPVACGRMRSKQDRVGDGRRARGMVLLIHGDAAFAGEGIVQETLNMSQLPGYTTGGALHVVVNNQLGFTTPPDEGRSSVYATDVAKMLQIPIFHVNGEDPEAVAQTVHLGMEFRKRFARDVVIDMYCYRRRGHNESDEPTFTQPLMYRKIENRDSVRESYLKHLLNLGGISREEAEQIEARSYEKLDQAFAAARQQNHPYGPQMLGGVWRGYQGGSEPPDDEADSTVPRERAAELLQKLTELPENFHLHRKLRRAMQARTEMAQGERPLDWSAAEALAFASLSIEGRRVRLSGQDSARGTFSQRHAVLFDTEDGRPYMPLQNLAPNQAPVNVINSPLSEAGVLGFEYGYSLDCPDGLILWEAQFGDFANAAQVIIDQFIASAEDKWRRLSGLVLLLPHGYEGQGPEHSSARIERFLDLAADDNLQLINPTTPAQYFHALRRQALRRWRKPLVVFTPKSLLRHPRAVSPLEDFESGRFQRILADPWEEKAPPERVLLCSGKLYYDLLEACEQQEHRGVRLIRLEQIYPIPELQLRAALADCPEGTPVYWVQEEPENMGPWRFLRVHWGERLFGTFPLHGVSRPPSASPATGSHAYHELEQQQVLSLALAQG